jgi:hypothetical protein
MNYDQVSQLTADDEGVEDVDLGPSVTIQHQQPTLRQKAFYVCLGVFLTAKVVVVCWFFTLSYSADALSRLFGF